MPNPHPRRPQLHHRVSRPLVFAAVLGFAGVPVGAALPGPAASAATPASACFAAFTASSAADLVTLRQVDLRPLGLTGAPTPRALLGSTRTGVYAGSSPLVGARAGQSDTGGASNSTIQLAPPNAATPAVRTASPAVHGQVHAGVRTMTAAATLRNANLCDAASGPATRATFSLGSESTIAGRDEPMIAVPASAATSTEADLVKLGTGYAAQATASTAVTDLHLLDTVSIRVTGAPSLRVTATGTARTSTVTYTAGAVSVAGPTRPGVFQPVGTRLDLIAPLDAGGADAAAAVARSTGAQPLPATTMGTVLAALGVPTPAPAALAGRVLIIRISPGWLGQQNLGTTVHALAAAVQLQLLVRSARLDAPAETQIAEYAVGGLEALALAPAGGYPAAGAGIAMIAPTTAADTTRGTTAPRLPDQAEAGNTSGPGTGQAPAGGDHAEHTPTDGQPPATAPAADAPPAGGIGAAGTRRSGGRRTGDSPSSGNGGGTGGGGGLIFAGDGPETFQENRTTLILGTVILLIVGVRLAGTVLIRRGRG